MNMDEFKNLMNLAEEVGEGKYFYLAGDAERETSYYDSDIHASIPESETLDNGWKSEKFETFEQVVDTIIDEELGYVDQKLNFPNDIEYLEDIKEENCTPKDYRDYDELLSYWTTRTESFGDEYHEELIEVSREIQICKLK